MGSRLAYYKDLEERALASLESQYSMHIINGAAIEAYNVLGQLMRFKLINKFDDRLSKQGIKIFTKAGIDKDHRFKIDIRKDSNYIGDWLLGQLPHNYKVVLISKEHIGERRDFGYLVDITLPQRELEVNCSLVNTPASAKRELIKLAEEFEEENGKKLNIKELTEEVYTGCTRIYTLDMVSTTLDKYKKVGHLLVYKNMKTGQINIKALIKSKVLYYYFIDIRQALNTIKKSIIQNFTGLSNCSVGFLADYKKSVVKQKKIVEENNKRLSNMKYLQENNITTFD